MEIMLHSQRATSALLLPMTLLSFVALVATQTRESCARKAQAWLASRRKGQSHGFVVLQLPAVGEERLLSGATGDLG